MPFPDSALLLALPLVAGLAYALGAQRTQAAQRRELRQAREAARAAEQLQSDWRWASDESHSLTQWQGPGAPLSRQCRLWSEPAVKAQLQAQQAFAGLRVRSDVPVDGQHSWELRGVPRWDDAGRFEGYVGSAHPLDASDALRLAAGLSARLLDAWPGAALVLRRGAQGWAVQQCNGEARTLWPAAAEGRAVAEARGALPSPLVDMLLNRTDSTDADSSPDIEGWRVRAGGQADTLLVVKASAASLLEAGADGNERDTFSFTLSHDLRAPIRVVEGFTRIVKEDYGRMLDRVGNDHLDRVLGAAARMNLMIDALLTLARLSEQPLARQRVSLSQLAGYVVDDLRRSSPEREVEFDIAPGLVAQGDPTLLRLVLENLLGNAWKYTAKVPQAQISLQAHPHAAHPAFVVRDNGAGFDMRSAERLFGLFQRLHSASDFPGHGVGLASVRRIVQRHGGQIWAESEPGRGAAFMFTLPD